MLPSFWPPIPTKTGFVRLKFESLQDWSGTVHVTGNVDDPSGSLVVHVASDAAFRGVPLDVRIEESADGVEWVERTGRPRRIDVVGGDRAARGAASPTRPRARRARRSHG